MAGMVISLGASPTAPQVAKAYTPLGVDLQLHFERALQNGPVQGGPALGEEMERSIMARSAPTDFSIRCVFSTHMELGRSNTVPCGSPPAWRFHHRCVLGRRPAGRKGRGARLRVWVCIHVSCVQCSWATREACALRTGMCVLGVREGGLDIVAVLTPR